MVSDVLASGKSSRLHKRLVYDEQLATDVEAYEDPNEISGQFEIMVTAKPGGDLGKIEKAINEEVARFLAKGPTAGEVQQVKANNIASFVRGLERIGGFGGKSDILAMNQTYRGDPNFYQTNLDYVRGATPKDLQTAAQRWLNDDAYILTVQPYPSYETSGKPVDRATLPTPGPAPEVKFPEMQRATLANGLKLTCGGASFGPDRGFLPCGKRRVCGRSIREPGHGQAGAGHAGRRDPLADGAADS